MYALTSGFRPKLDLHMVGIVIEMRNGFMTTNTFPRDITVSSVPALRWQLSALPRCTGRYL